MRRLISVALASAAVASASLMVAPASAAFPERPVRIVVPSTPGGGLDVVARIIGAKLSEMWKEPVIVDDRSGAGGIVGTDNVAHADPDGYTLLFVTTGFSNNPYLYKTLPYKTPDDFKPITIAVTNADVLIASSKAPFHTIQEMIKLAKEKPGSITFGSSGVGTGGHLVMSLVQSVTGTQMTHVPYKGAGASVNGVVSGEVQVLATAVGAATPYIQSKSVIPLAVTGAKRTESLPDVPTLMEAGVPDLDHTGWEGFFAPAGTPDAVIDKIYQDVATVLKMPAIVSQLKDLGYDTGQVTPAEFGKFLKDDIERAGITIKAAGLKPE
jgi:tripartite-type tricarboxylate transporter receptor subunit TctC